MWKYIDPITMDFDVLIFFKPKACIYISLIYMKLILIASFQMQAIAQT